MPVSLKVLLRRSGFKSTSSTDRSHIPLFDLKTLRDGTAGTASLAP